jgi:trimethylamine-N-oxide reductase (cytochrome c)
MKEAGIKFISIDPVYTDTAKALGAEWVPIKPSTDMALILAICYELYVTGKYSKSFIDKYTVGFSVFRRYFTGEMDGVKKTPEWAEKICGISADKIRELAVIFNTNNTVLGSHYGPQRTEHGEQVHWGMIALASMIGQIGTAGGGLHLGEGGLVYSGKSTPRRISQGRNPARKAIPASRIGDMLLNPGKTIDFNGGKITYPRTNVLYSMGANAITHHQDTNEFLRGMMTVENIITHEIVWTPTAKFSDIVLPVTTTFERDDITYGDSNVSYVWAMRKVIEPLYEAKDDYWILQELSKMLGFEKKFTKGRTIMDWVKWSFERVETDLSFEEFWERGYIDYEADKENREYIRMEDFIADPKNHPLYTPSGKIEIYSEKVASFGYRNCKGYPSWMEPVEWLGGRKAEKHEFHLMSIHPKNRLHSQMDNLTLRHSYKVKGREPAVIHPEDAKRLQVENGDLVEIYNDRGSIVCGVVVSYDVLKSVVRVDEGAWYAPETPEIGARCLNGNVNVLTSSRPTSMMSQACTAHNCLVSIKKIDGKVKENSAYRNPKVINSLL